MVNDQVSKMMRTDRLLLDQACLQWIPPVHSDDDEDEDDDDTTDGQVDQLPLFLAVFHVKG